MGIFLLALGAGFLSVMIPAVEEWLDKAPCSGDKKDKVVRKRMKKKD